MGNPPNQTLHMDLPEQVLFDIESRRLLEAGSTVLVAVSGGLDSMVLLDLLNRFKKERKWTIQVAHFNHRLRGEASEADAQFVADKAREWGMECRVGSGDVHALQKGENLSLEMAARRLRHQFLARCAREIEAQQPTQPGVRIATGHHADDQVELFFVRLLRGAASSGLAGMRWRATSPVDQGIPLVRPLLGCSRQSLMEYAEQHQIPYRHDASNDDNNIIRNRLRHQLLPLVRQQYQPALNEVVVRAAAGLGDEADYIKQQAQAWLEGKTGVSFEKLHPALQRQVVLHGLLSQGIPPNQAWIETLRLHPGVPLAINRHQLAVRFMDGHIELQPIRDQEFNCEQLEVILEGECGDFTFGDLRIDWSIHSEQPLFPGMQRLEAKRDAASESGIGSEVFDADCIGRHVVLRHWQPGDRFQPIGMQQSIKIQDFLTNLKIPLEERRHRVLGEAMGRGVFWIEGTRIAEPFKVTPRTRRYLKWQWASAAR